MLKLDGVQIMNKSTQQSINGGGYWGGCDEGGNCWVSGAWVSCCAGPPDN